jgi:hypothetical protein
MTLHDEIEGRRKRVLKTAWLFAVVAMIIFIAFILSGVLGT